MAMLSFDAYSASPRGFRRPSAERSGLHRLFAAAIVSDQFRATLLREPAQALANGYLFQTFTDLIFVLDADGVILDYKSSDSLLPYTFPGTTLNRTIQDVFPADVAGKLEHVLHMVQQTGEVGSLEYAIPIAEREYW